MEADGGRPLCLSLTNTRHFRNGTAPRETLADYGDLVEWAAQRKVVGRKEATRLAAAAKANPGAARRELDKTIALREAIARVFAARARGSQTAPDDLAIVTATFNEAARPMKLAIDREGIVPCIAGADAGIALPRWQAAVSAIALLTSEAAARVKECADDRGCGWLFVDATRNGSRMYCFSNECGNRARQLKFRERRRAESGAAHAHAD